MSVTVDCGEGRHDVCSGSATKTYLIPQLDGERFECGCYCHHPKLRVERARSRIGYLLELESGAVFVTSDNHWEHKNIQAYENRPDGHYQLMRDRWFETVAADDVVLHLGDLCVFGKKENHDQWVDGLPGRKYLLLGNHDDRKQEWYEGHGFQVLGRERLLFDAGTIRLSFSHEPDADDGEWDVNVHGHLHANEHRGTASTPERRRNVCVELHDYRPVRLRDVLSLTST